jgi:formamidopyrimidine-DNA glycosylase
LGNLLTDEVLWRAGLAPTRPAGSLTSGEHTRLGRAVRTTLSTLGRRGGSHTGDLQEHRQRDGICPRDGSPLVRATVGGRTTYWCPLHQS